MADNAEVNAGSEESIPQPWRRAIRPAQRVGLSPVPSLVTGDADIDRAFRVALGDIVGNIALFQGGLLSTPAPVILAGLGYEAPWTRDAAINAWNGAGLLMPEVTRNTLLSVVTERDGQPIIGGQYNQYWDSIIWVLGAWAQYVYTGDRDWLAFAFETSRNSIKHMEDTEFDEELGLFRGPAVYGDGISCYPDIYARTGGSTAVLDWVAANPDLKAPKGAGLPMHALSTNWLYYEAYRLLINMACVIKAPYDPEWYVRQQALHQAIERHLWDESAQRFRYLIDPFGGSEAQEGLGNAFALLFDQINPARAKAIFRSQHITPAGVPCVWPTFPRYKSADGQSFGRHSGTVWPFIQAFWAEACVRYHHWDGFEFEMRQLAAHISRDAQCAELYHPLTGQPYGGAPERVRDDPEKLIAYPSWPRQTWSATGYLRMVLTGLLGANFASHSVAFDPAPLSSMERIELRQLRYRDMVLNITVDGHGHELASSTIDGRDVGGKYPLVPANGTGMRDIHITMRTS